MTGNENKCGSCAHVLPDHEECEFPKDPKSQAILAIERKVIESRTKMVRDISLKWSAAESRVAVLEGLLDQTLMLIVNHLRCDVLMEGPRYSLKGQHVLAPQMKTLECLIVAALAPAPLTTTE